MFYSVAAYRTNRAKIHYSTILYGTQVDIYFPDKLMTIRSDFDYIKYKELPDFSGKVLLPTVFKPKLSNQSSIPFLNFDEENVLYSLTQFPIGSLVVARANLELMNYQIRNSLNSNDEEVIYYSKYMLAPYTPHNRNVNPTELAKSRDESFVTDLSSVVEADNKLEVAPDLTSTIHDKPAVIRRIKES